MKSLHRLFRNVLGSLARTVWWRTALGEAIGLTQPSSNTRR
jgi:hypothetical protein